MVVSAWLPWWTVGLTGLVLGWFWGQQKLKKPFLSGLLSSGFAWIILAALMNAQNDFELSTRLTETFMIPHPVFLYVLHGLIGGLLGGSGMVAGYATYAGLNAD